MVDQQLKEDIIRRLQAGQSRDEIEAALQQAGWEDIDVREAFSQIQREALQQLPVISTVMNFISRMDKKYAHLSAKATIVVLGAFAFSLIVLAIALYALFDPIGINASARDSQREAALVSLQEALAKYFAKEHRYPASLDMLVPSYVSSVPSDPKTKRSYDYKILSDKVNYQLCVNFEVNSVQCVNSYTIGGKIFLDNNGNGQWEQEEEKGYDGALVALHSVRESRGTKVCEIRSEQEGLFVCPVFSTGEYRVELQIPQGYILTSSNPQSVLLSESTVFSQRTGFVTFGIKKLEPLVTSSGSSQSVPTATPIVKE